jgi:Ca-activated chloride channel family protein
MNLRKGSRTGLVVYAGTAHLVLPPAEDPALMDIFLEALATNLMPVAGKNASSALAEAERLLGKESAPGTIVFFTDGFDTSEIPDFTDYVKKHPERQLLLIGVGTAQGGPLRGANDRPVLDTSGRPVSGSFDGVSLKKLASDADIPLASLTLDDDDIQWIQRRAEKHLQAVEAEKAQLRWKEAGYWLCFPVALIAAFGFRRGWVLRWLPVALIALAGVAPRSAHADDLLIRLFMTPDQQGRWHYEHGDYAKAATRFENTEWRAWASYRAGKYADALNQFARSETPEAYLMMGNCYAKLGEYQHALTAYDNALKLRKPYAEASANRALVAALIPKEKKDDGAEVEQVDEKPDQIKYDNKTGKSKKTMQVSQKLSTEIWMRNLKVSPADFLREKFAQQAHDAKRKAAP